MNHVYVHIPFCKSICSYCDFCKMFYKKDWADKYLVALKEEIKDRYHNDPLYTNDPTTDFGQFLHSSKMDFIHPITKEEMHFEAPLPKEFQEFIDELAKEMN